MNTMKHIICIITLAALTVSGASAQSHQAVMRDGPLDLSAPRVTASEGYDFNFRLGGDQFFILSEADLFWGGVPNLALVMQSHTPGFAFLTPFAAGEFYFAGTVFVGLPSYGNGDLIVKGDISEAGSQLSRWRGTGTSDPASPQGGDLFYRTDTSKVRIYADGAWMNLN